jgi:hypothetical protein
MNEAAFGRWAKTGAAPARAGARRSHPLTFALDWRAGVDQAGPYGFGPAWPQRGGSIVRSQFVWSAGFAGALFVLGAGGAATAGTVIALDEAVNDAAPQSRTMVLDADRLRMSSAATDIIFRGDLNKVWVLRSKDHSYLELTAAGLGQMGARMDQAMAKMKEKLAALPEAQRKQIEAMMAARMGQGAPSAAPQATYEKSGDSRTVGEWSCAPYRIVVGGKASSEVCIAKLSDLGLSRDDLAGFASFGAFMAKMTAAMGALRSPMTTINFDSMTKAIGFDGFPVQTTTKFGDGSRQIVVTLKSIQHEDPPAGAFDIPAGYTKIDFASMGRLLAPQ